MAVYVVTMRTQDGYDIPILAAASREIAEAQVKLWQLEHEGDGDFASPHYSMGEWVSFYPDAGN